jgi:hypothetical protein
MVAFTDSQLRAIWTAADRVPFEKRGVFVERVVARLQLHRGFTDADLDDALRAALTGLIQSVAWSGPLTDLPSARVRMRWCVRHSA